MSFSFLNGKSPFDEAEERLEAGETVNGKPKMPVAPAMGWQDGVTLLVIIALVIGGYQYYQYVKRSSAEAFAACDTIYAAIAGDVNKYAEMEKCYEATWDLGFVSDSLEILRQNRLGEVEDLRNIQKDLLASANAAFDKGDTAAAVKIVTEYKGAMLLYTGDQSEWNEIAKLKVAPAETAPAAEPAEKAAEPAPATK